MPGVGRYRRTGENEMTLTEIHAPMHADRLGITIWHKHDWLCLLAEGVGWSMISDQVEKADSDPITEEHEPKLEHIGKVFACECGMVYTLRGPDVDIVRMLVSEEGNCLNPICNIIIPLPHAGVLNEVNESAVIAKQEAQEMLAIAFDEDEYPVPFVDEVPIPEDVVKEEE